MDAQQFGVTFFEWTDGKITRFAAYFDPRALTILETARAGDVVPSD